MTQQQANEKQVGGGHYNPGANPDFYQHWDFVIDTKLPYLEAQATRYIDRHEKKNKLQDLQKALHYIQKLRECAVAARVFPPRVSGHDPRPHLERFFDCRPGVAPNDRDAFTLIVRWRGTADLDLAASAVKASMLQFYGYTEL